MHGEANSADMNGVERARETLAKVLSNFKQANGELVNFAPENIFNMDETGLFWRQQPSRTLAVGRRAGVKNVMERVTLGMACNMTGTEKLRPIAIGKAQRPRCFPKKLDVQKKLGMDYFWNKSAWMPATVFTKWAVELNERFAAQKRTCVVLVDNFGTHKVDGYEVRVRVFCNIIIETVIVDTVIIDAVCRAVSRHSQ